MKKDKNSKKKKKQKKTELQKQKLMTVEAERTEELEPEEKPELTEEPEPEEKPEQIEEVEEEQSREEPERIEKLESEEEPELEEEQNREEPELTEEPESEEKRERTEKSESAEAATKKKKKGATEGDNNQKNPRLRLGVWSAVMVVAVTAAAVLLNIFIGKWNVSWDLSQEKIYTISEQSKSIVRGLEQDITIYILDSEEGFPIGFKQILQQYLKNSSHIQVVYRDLTLYPNFPYEYVDTTATVNPDSLIVVCGENHVYLDSEEFSSMGLSEDGTTYGTIVEFEPLLTAAINSVNDGEVRMIYQTTGHNELSFSNSIQTGMMRDNFSLTDLSLLQASEVPEDADILIINAPTTDFSSEDCDKIRDYLDRGGSVYYILEATASLDNLDALMADYGIEVVSGIVMEQNLNMIYGGGTESATPTYIIPLVEDTEITHDYYKAGLAFMIPIARGLVEKSGSGYEVTGLLSTSSYAYSKVNLYSEYISREDDDILGPFYLAALSEREGAGTLLVLSSSNVLADNVDEVVSGNNSNFFLNGLNYLLGTTDRIAIRGKEIAYDSNLYSSQTVYLIGGISIVGIPALILVLGIVVVMVRKKRSQGMKRKKTEGTEKPEEVEEAGEPKEVGEPEES